MVWVSGPPGAGKTTLGSRASEYGFMVMDCEDKWLPQFAKDVPKTAGEGDHKHLDIPGRLQGLTNATNWAMRYAQSAMVFPACYSLFLARAPPHVLRVILLPGTEVYEARWRLRNPNDHQQHKYWYDDALRVWSHDHGASIVRVKDESASCPDSSLIEMCNGLVGFLQTHVTELCFYCARSSETSSFRSRYCGDCPAL